MATTEPSKLPVQDRTPTVQVTQAVARPDIFTYLDYRSFLRDYFAYLIHENRKYSQRWIAKKAGWKSPQLISMILKGQRKLARENAQLLSMVFELSEKEDEYFLILLDLESANKQDRQIEILDRIRFQFQDGLFRELPDTGFVYIQKWYYPAVRELASLKSFEVNSIHVAKALELTPEEASEALEILCSEGLLQKSASGYARIDASIRAPDYVSPLLMLQYHLQIIERAFKAVTLRRELRHFETLVVSMASKDIDYVRTKIQQFLREIDMFAESAPKRDDIFQLSIQFFSLTGGRACEISQGAKK